MLLSCYAGGLRRRLSKRDGVTMKGVEAPRQNGRLASLLQGEQALPALTDAPSLNRRALPSRSQDIKKRVALMDEESCRTNSTSAGSRSSNEAGGVGNEAIKSTTRMNSSPSTRSMKSPMKGDDEVQVVQNESNEAYVRRQKSWLAEQARRMEASTSRNYHSNSVDSDVDDPSCLIEESDVRPGAGWFGACKVCKDAPKPKKTWSGR